MCVNPVTLKNGVTVGCRQCWQCRMVKVDDLIGRCIAESVTCVATHVVTLTYGEDEQGNKIHSHAAVLQYSDVKHLLDRLRKQGFPCRYMIVGEYGAKRQRAHWHCVLMWTKKVPPLPAFERRLRWEWDNEHGEVFDFWPHGVVFVERPAYEKLRYNLKYALKNTHDDKAESRLFFSRRPPLGYDWFMRRARRMAEQRLVPVDGLYEFADVRRPGGEARKFLLRGKSHDLFMEEYCRHWRYLYGDEHFPPSPYFEEWLDSGETDEFLVDSFGTRKGIENRRWKVGGFVSSFQPNAGAREWLERPVEVKPLESATEIRWDRPRESYAQFRMRQLREGAKSRDNSSSEDRNRSVKR